MINAAQDGRGAGHRVACNEHVGVTPLEETAFSIYRIGLEQEIRLQFPGDAQLAVQAETLLHVSNF